MKIRLFFLMTCVIISFSSVVNAYSYAGTYDGEYGMNKINISRDSLIIMAYDGDEFKVKAECKYKRVGKDFIEINSVISPYDKAIKTMSIKYNKQSVDSTELHPKVNFILSDTISEFTIDVYCGNLSYNGITKNGQCQFTLNRNPTQYTFSTTFTFYIKPKSIFASNLAEQYLGVIGIFYPFGIEYNENDLITIELPSVTEELFSNYYIRGEYIHIVNDKLEWRGEGFYRE
ncbi:MAG: hypothetical protein K2K93_07075 [Muribaculaceae bacterium]|nr:hypothetical protein [Muribaculaceae bacterium]